MTCFQVFEVQPARKGRVVWADGVMSTSGIVATKRVCSPGPGIQGPSASTEQRGKHKRGALPQRYSPAEV